MRHALYIAIAAASGLVAAIAFWAAVADPPASLPLIVLAALPVFIVGFGWSSAAAVLAAAVGSLALIGFGFDTWAPWFAAVVGGPAFILTYLAGLEWRVEDASGESRLQRISPGLLVAAAAIVAGCIGGLIAAHTHGDMAATKLALKGLLAGVPPLAQAPPTAEQMDQLVDDVFQLLPATGAVLIVIGSLLNLWLAGRIALAAGQFTSTWPDVAAMRLPRGTPLVLSAALIVAATQSGVVSATASGVSGAFFAAYVLLGLAVLHYVSRGKSWRTFLLAAAYTGLAITHVWTALPLVVLGLIDTIFPLRRLPALVGHT